jgi:hypothetical protein
MNPHVLARFIFAEQPSWIGALIQVRDAVVAGFGLMTARHLATLSGDAAANRIGIFKVYGSSEAEVVLGEDDRHLDFRASALYQPPAQSGVESARLVFSTVVHCHNSFGRGYLGVIAPFHRLVVKSYLRHGARIGWPSEDGTSAAAVRSAVV